MKKEKQGLICDLALNLLNRYKNELADESDKLRILSQHSEWVLRAMQIVDKDKDGNVAATFPHKIHIPIQTNDKVFFFANPKIHFFVAVDFHADGFCIIFLSFLSKVVVLYFQSIQ